MHSPFGFIDSTKAFFRWTQKVPITTFPFAYVVRLSLAVPGGISDDEKVMWLVGDRKDDYDELLDCCCHQETWRLGREMWHEMHCPILWHQEPCQQSILHPPHSWQLIRFSDKFANVALSIPEHLKKIIAMWINECIKIYKWRLTVSTQNNVCLQCQVPPQAKNTITLGQYNPQKFTTKTPDRNHRHT